MSDRLSREFDFGSGSPQVFLPVAVIRKLRSVAAAGLAVILVALTTGLPSHYHERTGAADDRTAVVTAEHHSHGTRLIEQDEGVTTPLVALVEAAMVLVPVEEFIEQLPVVATCEVAHAGGRDPPPCSPRAPPVPA